MWGYRSVVATVPYTAIALAKGEPVDLFKLDIGMPGMDGYELGAALKEEYPVAGFIGKSAWPRNLRREAARAFAFHAHVQKPIGFTTLEKLIPVILARKTGLGTCRARLEILRRPGRV
ncbi:response regulator [Noviherbaspirillum aerium]|uniref:response regulator n=1 Tax=Noviherbaspirillum aerium TaxID=2588497 RepID=UPI00124BDEE1